MEFSESPKEENKDLIPKENSSTSKNSTILKIILFTFIAITVIGLGIFLIIILTKNQNSPENSDITPNLLRLKQWESASTKKVTLSAEELSLGKEDVAFLKAPEEDYVCTAMSAIAANSEEDLFFEENLKKIDALQFDDDWLFRSRFEFNKDIKINKKENLFILIINGINFRTDIFLDGKQIAKQSDIKGTFIKYKIDITDYLDETKNTHFIVFKMKRPQNRPYEGDDQIDLAISFVDWNPPPPDSNMGIWQPVEIEMIPKKMPILDDGFVITKLNEDNSEAKVDIVIQGKNFDTKNIFRGNLKVSLGKYVENCEVKNILLQPGEEKQIVIGTKECPKLVISNPDLWWPYQMGKPTLHKLEITIYQKDNVSYTYKKKIGLREVKSELSEDGKVRLYFINGKKIFLKGAGWSPDMFLRQSPENYKKHIEYVIHMEMNVIRLEGKSEGQEFYDLCDKLGLLIISGWNCCDAWQKWELWPTEAHEIGKKSTLNQIRKLSSHPCVIIFIQGSDKHPTEEVENSWNEIFDKELWPNEVLSSATASESKISGKTGAKMTGPYSWVPPHYYVNDFEEITGGAWGFFTEGGPGENPLEKGSYEKVFDKENLTWPLSESWNYHCGSNEPFYNLHYFLEPLEMRYGNVSDFEDFQKKSIASVYEGHRAFFEAYAFHKYRATGYIQWMLNNAWPSNIWHLYDYFFAPSAAYFCSRKAGERVHVLYGYNGKDNHAIYLLNNYYEDFVENSIETDIFVYSEKNWDVPLYTQSEKNGIKADSVEKITELNITDLTNEGGLFILHLEYQYEYNGEKIFKTNTYWFSQEMDKMIIDDSSWFNTKVTKYADLSGLSDLPKTNITITEIKKEKKKEAKKTKIEMKIKNEGKIIALLVNMKLYNKNREMILPIFWEDNYFSIRSGAEQKVSVEFDAEGEQTREGMFIEINGWNVPETKVDIN